MDKKHDIVMDYGVLGSKGDKDIHLTLISWFGKNAVYDIRPWDEEMEVCGKGISLNRDQLEELYHLLKNIVEDKG